MPVSVAFTITDPPSAPPGYTLCAFEVRTVKADGQGILPVAVLSGTTAGFEEAANILVKAVAASLRDVGVGIRLAAVAWWIDQRLTEQTDGRERLVSVYDAGESEWGQWTAEERIGPGDRMATVKNGARAKQTAGSERSIVGEGRS